MERHSIDSLADTIHEISDGNEPDIVLMLWIWIMSVPGIRNDEGSITRWLFWTMKFFENFVWERDLPATLRQELAKTFVEVAAALHGLEHTAGIVERMRATLPSDVNQADYGF